MKFLSYMRGFLGCLANIYVHYTGWEAQLQALIKEHKIQFAFDAIAGDMTGDCPQT